MGFLFGFLMFVSSYLILGPIMMSFYTSLNQKNASNSNKSLLFGLAFSAIYIIIWVICIMVDYLNNYIGWLICGSIVGLICAIVTFNKNKVQTLIDIETDKPFQEKYKGTELLFSEILKEISNNGINYVAYDNPIPYICQIMQHFDKSKVEWAIKEFNPDLNIRLKNDEGMEICPLDLMAICEDKEMFDLLLREGAQSINYHLLAMILIRNNSYDMLSSLLTYRKFDINKSLTEVIDDLKEEDDKMLTLLDLAEVYSHEKIKLLLKLHGAKSSMDLTEYEPINDLKQRTNNIYAGKIEKFSTAEIVDFSINLKSFKDNLSYEIYQLALNKYNEYHKNKEKKEYNRQQFIQEMIKIQEEFSNIIGREVYPDGTIKKST